jgi:hypothetical protein
MPQPTEVQNRILYSWKEIAVFLKCGLRTAQRWERDEKLPVHRHNHQRRGTVYSLTNEIETWLKTREPSETIPSAEATSPLFLDVHSLWSICTHARERAARVRGQFRVWPAP